MKLQWFLQQLDIEKFPFRIEFNGGGGWIDVIVDAFYERWVISFDDSAYLEHEIFVDADLKNYSKPAHPRELFNRPEKSWKTAGEELGFELICPYYFSGPEGIELKATGLLPEFGGKKGTLIISRKDEIEVRPLAEATNDYFIPAFNPYHYDRYSRELFIDALNDLGWSGRGNPPSWFLGRIINPND